MFAASLASKPVSGVGFVGTWNTAHGLLRLRTNFSATDLPKRNHEARKSAGIMTRIASKRTNRLGHPGWLGMIPPFSVLHLPVKVVPRERIVVVELVELHVSPAGPHQLPDDGVAVCVDGIICGQSIWMIPVKVESVDEALLELAVLPTRLRYGKTISRS